MNLSDKDLDTISNLHSQDEQLDFLSKKYPNVKFNVDNKGVKIGDTYLPQPQGDYLSKAEDVINNLGDKAISGINSLGHFAATTPGMTTIGGIAGLLSGGGALAPAALNALGGMSLGHVAGEVYEDPSSIKKNILPLALSLAGGAAGASIPEAAASKTLGAFLGAATGGGYGKYLSDKKATGQDIGSTALSSGIGELAGRGIGKAAEALGAGTSFKYPVNEEASQIASYNAAQQALNKGRYDLQAQRYGNIEGASPPLHNDNYGTMQAPPNTMMQNMGENLSKVLPEKDLNKYITDLFSKALSTVAAQKFGPSALSNTAETDHK